MTKDLKELINHIKRELGEFYQDHLDDDDTEVEIIADLREWTALVEYIEKAKTYEEGIVKGFSHNIKTVEELEERIKKAIEFIEKSKLNGNKVSEMLCGSEIMTLLEILKGE